MHGWIQFVDAPKLKHYFHIQVDSEPSVIVMFMGKHQVLPLERWVFTKVENLLSDWSKDNIKEVSLIEFVKLKINLSNI